jgi:hypothetical protein
VKRQVFASTSAMVTLATAAASTLVLPMPAFGQSVADRTLSDVKVENVGGCITLTVNFNIRIQMLSFFPESSGRELHVRIRPLDAANANSLRESLRTPSSVPELRSIEYEGDNSAGPVLSLFFTRDMRFQLEAGTQPQALVIRLAEPGSGQICLGNSAALPAPTPTPPTSVGSLPAARPGLAIPAGLYAINVLSQPKSLGTLAPAQAAAIEGNVIYETQFERDSQQWHRLRVGFFESREAADAAKVRMAAQFPDAWVVKVTADERAQGVASRTDSTPAAPVATPVATPANTTVSSEADVAATASLIGEAEQAIKGGDNDRAIQLLTNASTKPENQNSPRALELLGLTRERKGQNAHAQAEYEEYLRRYPIGEASDRVRQRLASLGTSTMGVTAPTLRAASGDARSAAAWTWGARGSFSQFYFRDQSTSKIPDATNQTANTDVDKSVNLNQLLTTADLTISGGNDRRQLQIRSAGSYSKNFGTSSTTITNGTTTFNSRPGAGIKSLTALYLDYSENDLNLNARVGRQTRNSAGVLGRFDGALLNWRAKPKLKLNIVGGFPVLTSRQMRVLTERYFYGASVDFGGRNDALQTTLYWFDQRARGSFVDRRSVGIEARFLKPRFNAYTIVDYDVKFKKLNLGLLSLNYNFPDNSNLSLTADYRNSPLLTTTNALTGMTYNLATFAPVTSLVELRPFFTDDEIYQAAKDNTLVAKSLTVSYSRPLTKKLQANADFTMTDTGGTRGILASSGTNAIPAQLATGKEYYYGVQLVGSGLLWSNDIYILSGRYANSSNARTWTVDFNARVPITSSFRLSPRVRYGMRDAKASLSTPVPGTFRQLQPTLRLNYYPIKHSEIEIEFGGNFSRQRNFSNGAFSTIRESGWVLSAGYRIDF